VEFRNVQKVDATLRKVASEHHTGRACLICSHPDRDMLDRELALERKSQAQVAREVGCNRSSISRHVKNHLLPAIRRKAGADPALADLDILTELRNLYGRMKQHLKRAEKVDNWQAIRAFHSEARQDLELLARLLGELQESQTVNVLMMPEWVTIRAVLLTALLPYPEARAAAAQALQGVERVGK
jgi:hypothetical protein